MRDVKDTIFTTGYKLILNELENRKLISNKKISQYILDLKSDML